MTATLVGAIALPPRPIALDALLAAAVVVRDQVPPAMHAGEVVPIEVPLARDPRGRFHLASVASYEAEVREARHVTRRPVVEEAQAMGDPKRKRMQISAGPDKAYRFPLETAHLVDDRLDWWCVGDAREIEELLGLVGHLGKKRSVGLGRVREWRVTECEPWGDGFPVVMDERPLRPLPLDWPGVHPGSARAFACLTYPYWLREREVEAWVP